MKVKIVIILTILLSVSIFLMVGCKPANTSSNKETTTVGTTNKPANIITADNNSITNPEELKIEVSSEAKAINDKVTFSDVKMQVNNGVTTVTGSVNNKTDKIITPYMNIYFFKGDKKIVTANAFASKIPANGSKVFTSSITGDFSGTEVKVELASLEN